MTSLQIDIDPPIIGPLRLGMSESEAIEALSHSGFARSGSGRDNEFYLKHPSGLMLQGTMDDTGSLTEIGLSPLSKRARAVPHLFRGVHLFQPYQTVLVELSNQGLPILSDSIQFNFAIEAVGLLMGIHTPGDRYFSHIDVATPEVFAQILRIGVGMTPFTPPAEWGAGPTATDLPNNEDDD